MPSVYLQLSQTKRYAGPERFLVLSEVIDTPGAPTVPPLLRNCLVIDLAVSGPDKERFVRVATLDDLVAGVIPVRPLSAFRDAGGPIAAQSGDLLVFREGSTPPEWGGGVPAFTVAGPDGLGGLVVASAFDWSVPEPSAGAHALQWQLLRFGSAVQGGTQGWTYRVGGDGLSLVSRFAAVFPDGAAALNHLAAVQAYAQSLASAAGLDEGAFLQHSPGNPVVNVYP